MQHDLFSQTVDDAREPFQFSEAGFHLPAWLAADAPRLIDSVRECVRMSPLRHFTTPGGKSMSVLSSNCGDYGWVADPRGYRYAQVDPVTEKPWPAMPDDLRQRAISAAKHCGFTDFRPDVCLINVYKPGAAMGLHQDKDESDFGQPIVSFSFGLPVTFLWGGLKRGGSPQKIPLQHSDVLVWGREDRLRYHGIKKLADGRHPLTGNVRINLTFRMR